MNGFLNLIYTNNNFSAGLRYESYLNALQGFDPRYQGNGIPYRYASYLTDNLEITAGNFYEQFGNGLIFRSYEERGLGLDNAMDGIRLKYFFGNKATLKVFIGKQRFFFDQGPGIVRGADGEVNINELINLSTSKTKIIAGGSVISKYQKDQDPIYNLPENVAAFAGRLNIIRGKINLMGEYAYKINDPSTINDFIYKPGEALLLNCSYSQKGLGISLGAKRIDNMSFSSDRTAVGNALSLSYLPALTKQHTYLLAAFYPYASQPNGEIGFQGEIVYTFKQGSKMGGKYGTSISLNYSRAQNIDTTNLNNELGYDSNFFKLGKEVYFQDFNIELIKRWNKKIKTTLSYINLTYNKDVIQGLAGYGRIYADVAIADITFKINANNSIRTELQHLRTEQDHGNWALILAEYTIAPHWFLAAFDEYNYGNELAEDRIHYFTASIGYIKNANRFSLSYGRQREGILCVGGVCRNVPASNGILFSITSSF